MDRLKLYPDGSITVASIRRGKRDGDRDPLVPDDFIGVMGLSSPTISHSVSANTKRQGIQGMSARQRREVRCNSVVLTNKLGRNRAAFITLTFPFQGELLAEANRQMNELMRRMNQKLRHRWERAGLPDGENQLCFVLEPQTKRWERHGEFALHAHIVAPSRPKGSIDYMLQPDDLKAMWRDTCVSVLGSAAARCSYDAATQIDGVRRDPAAYLSKYMGKGGGDVQAFLDAGVPADQIPKRWWGATDSLKAESQAEIQCFDLPCGISYEELAEALLATAMFLWCRPISIERGGETRFVGVCGRLRREVSMDAFLPVFVAIATGQKVPATPQNLPLAG